MASQRIFAISVAVATFATTGASANTNAEVVPDSVSARCQALVGGTFGGATVLSAEHLKSGTFTNSLPQPIKANVCRVRAIVKPVPGSEIKIEIWLPDSWNGKLAGLGGGGFDGGYDLAALTLRKPTEAGYVGVVTNAGHDRGATPKWALAQPEKIIDFGHRANHLGAVASKALAATYYGSSVKRALFHGCSNGGRDALMLAQRYPLDYDAIVAGAPANDYSGLMSSFAYYGSLSRQGELSASLPGKLKLLRNAVVAKCDAADGVKDGLISNPGVCRFNPAVLSCKPGQAGDACLTPPELNAVRMVYAGARLKAGQLVMPGLPFGSEGDWTAWLTGPKAEGANMATSFYRYFVHSDEAWSPARFDLDRDWSAGRATVSGAIDAINPDLKAFLGRGGRLLMYHGWEDAAIPAGNSQRYFAAMQRAVGPRLSINARLFMLPGVGHCMGGSGPDTVDYFAEADRWLESGRAPDRIVATKYSTPLAAFGLDGGPATQTRPACAWPKSAHYVGKGSTKDAGSFECR